MSAKILVAGIGNIFLGDDAFGIEVVKNLSSRPLPEWVRVVDFGIRGFDLTYALLEDWDAVIFVDAVSRGEAPGTIYVIEPDLSALNADGQPQEMLLEPHGMDPVKVLRLAMAMGGKLTRILLVGCEPDITDPDGQGYLGLSDAVQNAIEEAARTVERLVTEIQAGVIEHRQS
jgi:hydrogenase maturation protease